ncbi:hypothetical protein T01_15290 [Trichinella spiralis]|uniref:Uncharacterized protein n=1 Tax=Trichinella spiralis TaxID=6334 RepID=A0A0V1B401_TRISP|nr:hypothetical protein T01_15290 [Trichinella spiralis]
MNNKVDKSLTEETHTKTTLEQLQFHGLLLKVINSFAKRLLRNANCGFQALEKQIQDFGVLQTVIL